MKKIDYKIKSTTKCSACDNLIKQNLINKQPQAKLCYRCYRISIGKKVKQAQVA